MTKPKDWLDGFRPSFAVDYCQHLLDEAKARGIIDTNVDLLLAANPAMRALIEQEIGRDVVMESMPRFKAKRGRPKGQRNAKHKPGLSVHGTTAEERKRRRDAYRRKNDPNEIISRIFQQSKK
jgi:hypothetical protein